MISINASTASTQYNTWNVTSNFPHFPHRVLQQIIAFSSNPLLITNKDAKIIYVNKAWEKLTGYALAEVTGKDPRLLKSEKTARKVFKKMWRTLSKGQRFWTDQVINKKKNGKEYYALSDIFSVFQNKETYFYVQLQHDITKLKRLDKLRKEFLSASAHELKTPITVLKLLTQSHLLKAKKSGSYTVAVGELELIDNELDRLVRLINDMLDTSRFETGKEFMAFEETNLVDLVKKTVQKIQIYAKNHAVIIESSPQQAIVIADPARIEQVLLNLLSNAIKYSSDGKKISVALEINDATVIVSVTDEGIGIPKNKQHLIFDKYYQLKAKNKIGFGLGLFISKEIIKRHKGKLWVESTKGKGSTFYFSLPLRV